MEWSRELVAAAAAPMVLSILAQGESYGYAIIKRVRELTHGEMCWTDGMLYPVLHRLEEQRHIRSTWRTGENGRRRKYYELLNEGQAHLARSKVQWQLVNRAFVQLWEPKACSI